MPTYYIARREPRGTTTVKCGEIDGTTWDPRRLLQEAIDSGHVQYPGEYVVAIPDLGLLNVTFHEVKLKALVIA